MQAKRLTVQLDPSAPRQSLNADPRRLQQIFWNLIGNAVKFTPSGGTITIRTSNPAGRDPEVLAVEIIDTGIGIEPHAMSRLFRAFEQGEQSITRQFGGLGLGLTVCKALAEMHGGTLKAQSAGLGHGATFRVELPLAAATAPPVLDKAEPSPTRLRLLLVEDNVDTARLLARLLRGMGHEVRTAHSVQDALGRRRLYRST